MYLARLNDKQHGWRYMIRQSYADGDCYRSRDLFDLGEDPAKFIIYPGGNGFYIDTAIEDAIAELGIEASQDDLESVFLPFLAAHVRRVIDGFDRRERCIVQENSCTPADAFHRFDRSRLHFLKLGRVDARDLACAPDRFYAGLADKSRDEIEHDFIAAERILKIGEVAHYIYQIFDLQQCFNEHYAHRHPEWLDQERLDQFFVDSLCELNQDRSFWSGCDQVPGLQPHLIRYSVMYFDSSFPSRDPFQDFLRDFMNRHRVHHSPGSVLISLEESARLFEVSSDVLKQMDCRTLTRRYRQLVQKHHPDKGGDQETFLKLTAAYQKLLTRKAGK